MLATRAPRGATHSQGCAATRLGSACCLLSTSRTPPALQPDTSESDAELSRLGAEVARLEASLGSAQAQYQVNSTMVENQVNYYQAAMVKLYTKYDSQADTSGYGA
eukprot:COSAG02_NODE_4223_length_5615_cov_2.992386_9_plen_106_part_00